MTTRARAMTVSELEGLTGQHNAVKRFHQPPLRANRAALGEIGNKGRSCSVSDQPMKALKPLGDLKPKQKKPLATQEENLAVLQNEVEKMEVSGVEENKMEQEIEDIDREDADNPQLVVEYVQDIYAYLRFLEKEQSVRPEYLEGQSVIMPKMRAVLVDWMIGVHLQFKLLPETVYTAVAILDRYLQNETKTVSRSTLQLVGAGAMLVASKYEEIFPPEVADFVYITDQAYSKKEILKMELQILHSLEFNLGRPLPIHFLRRASKAGGVEAITHTLAKYIMELSLSEYILISEPPSRLAAASLALSIRILDQGIGSFKEAWTPVLQYYTRYTLSQLKSTIIRLIEILRAAPSAKLSQVFSKYSSKKLLKISRIPALNDEILKNLTAENFD